MFLHPFGPCARVCSTLGHICLARQAGPFVVLVADGTSCSATAAKDWLPPKAEPVPVSPAPPASSGSVDEEGLRALKRLHDDGIIDDEEFASKKKKCLGI